MQTELKTFWAIIAASVAITCGPRVAAGEWTTGKSMPTARWGLTASVVDGKIYAIGGAHDAMADWFPTVEVYDSAADSWSARAALPYARAAHAAAVVNGKIYVTGGGAKLSTSTSTVDEYDPQTDTWSQKAAMPRDRAYHCAVGVGGEIYVFGGIGYRDNGQFFGWGPLDVYDPSTDQWAIKGPMRTPRDCTSACELNGKIYLIGGLIGGPSGAGSDGKPVTAADVYDPATDTWTPIASLPAAHAYPGVCAVGGKIYVMGSGYFFGSSSPRVDVYDPATDTWSLGPELSKAKYFLGASVIGSTIYLVGGTETAPWPTGISTVEAYASAIPLDTTPPELRYVGGSPTLTQVKVWFSEPVDPATAAVAANYQLSGGVATSAAALGAPPADNVVVLTTSAQPEGATLTLTVKGVTDLAGNVVALNSAKEFGTCVWMPGQVLHEFWQDVFPATLDQLRADARFPLKPSSFTWEPRVEFPPEGASSYDEGYGNKLSTWFVPDVTGDYVFLACSADASELYLSTDTDPANKQLIAQQREAGDPRLWTTAGGRSAPVHLEAGRKYYLESIHIEEQGADHVSATFIKAGEPDPSDGAAPQLAGNVIGYYLDPNMELKFTEEPADQRGDLPSPGRPVHGKDFAADNGGFTVINTDPEPPGPWLYDAAKGRWVAEGSSSDCGGPYASDLLSPEYTLSQGGVVLLSFNHRYSFEHRWDGGAVSSSLSGGAFTNPAANDFTLNGYAVIPLMGISVLRGQRAFSGESPGYDQQQFITSQVLLGNFKQGDTLQIRFVGAWDQCSTATHPNWEIASFRLNVLPESPTPTLLEGHAAASLYGQYRPVNYQWQRQSGPDWVDVPAATNPAWRFFPAEADFQTAFRLRVSVPGKTIYSRSVKLVSAEMQALALSITSDNGQVWLTFDGCLQTAPNVNGPYTDVAGAASPYAVPNTSGTAFFRCVK